MNTRLHYLYRDGSNNKEVGYRVFKGPETGEEFEELKKRFEATLDDHGAYNGNFIAEQLGIPSVAFWKTGAYEMVPDCDHCWHEYDGLEQIELPLSDGEERTLKQFVEDAEKVVKEGGWKDFDIENPPEWAK